MLQYCCGFYLQMIYGDFDLVFEKVLDMNRFYIINIDV